MTIEVTAKKVNDAINQGLEQLGATLDDVKVEVIDAGGLFRKAKVRLTLEEEKAPEAPAAKEEKPAPAKESAEPAKEKAEPVKEAVKSAEKPVVNEKNAQAPSAAAKQPSERSQKSQKQKSSQNKSKEKEKSSAQSDTGSKEQKPRTQKPDTDTPSDTADQSDTASATPEHDKGKRRLRKEDLEAAVHAGEFVKKTVELMGFTDFAVEADSDTGEHISITAKDGDDSLIIGRHGETLSALTYLAETCARAEKCHINIVVDCNGYRERRAASLTAMARRRAHESAAKRRRIKLEPMDRIDRRTIHCALADDAYVTTESEGKEPYRCVVIVPKAGERAPSEERDRRGKRGRNDRRDRVDAGPRPKRPVFDMKLHGKVGHIDETPESLAEDKE